MATCKPSRVVAISAIVLLTVAAPPAPTCAKDQAPWPVKGKLIGKGGGKSKDVSGIACSAVQAFPRQCLIIDDNLREAQFVTLKDGKITVGRPIRLIENKYKSKLLELDGEGVAYADGYYYVIGSHGHPRDKDETLDPDKDAAKIKAKITAASQVIRIRIKPDGTVAAAARTDRLRAIIAAEPALEPFMDRRLEKNGLTIEGVAVKTGRLFAGFRGPALEGGRAAILSVAADSMFGDSPPDPRLYRLPLGDGQGVRDLARFGDGILILAGPAADRTGAYGIFWWDGRSETVKFLKDLAPVIGKKGKRKAEAILPLDRTPSGLRMLILFDGQKEGRPIAVEVPEP